MHPIASIERHFYVAVPAQTLTRDPRPRCRRRNRISDVQLLSCPKPAGSLETAPPTSLRADSADERWDGFWSVADERYYARCTRTDGTEHWFRLVDEMPGADEAFATARMFKFPSRFAGRTTVSMRLLGTGKHAILVGTARRSRSEGVRS